MEDNNVKKMKSGLTQQQLAEIIERFTLITDPKAGTLDQASKHLKVILLGEELQFVKCIHYRDQVSPSSSRPYIADNLPGLAEHRSG